MKRCALRWALLILCGAVAVFAVTPAPPHGQSQQAQPAAGKPTKPNTPPASSPVKNKTAAGHYYGGHEEGYGHHGGGYEGRHEEGYGHHRGHHGGYGGGYGGYGQSYGHHLVDDFVCDLDASILVVTNNRRRGYGNERKEGYGKNEGYGKEGEYGKNEGHGYGNEGHGYGGYGEGHGYGHEGGHGYGHEGGYGDSYGHHHAVAHRLRCSRIAIRNDSDCTTCCQLAARRDRSVSKDSIIGFIVDYDQIHRANYEKGGEYGKNEAYKRTKRNASPPGVNPGNADYKPAEQSYGGGHQENKIYGNQGYEQKGGYGGNNYGGGYVLHRPHVPYFPPYNPRCVCCAPKRHHGGYNHHGYGHERGYGHHDGGYGHHERGYGHHEGGYENEGYGHHGGEYGHQGDEGYGHGGEYGHRDGYGGSGRYGHEGGYNSEGYGNNHGNGGYNNHGYGNKGGSEYQYGA